MRIYQDFLIIFPKGVFQILSGILSLIFENGKSGSGILIAISAAREWNVKNNAREILNEWNSNLEIFLAFLEPYYRNF